MRSPIAILRETSRFANRQPAYPRPLDRLTGAFSFRVRAQSGPVAHRCDAPLPRCVSPASGPFREAQLGQQRPALRLLGQCCRWRSPSVGQVSPGLPTLTGGLLGMAGYAVRMGQHATLSGRLGV